MTPALPQGEAAPHDGSLPAWVGSDPSDRAFGVYIHVPFCSVRCGYCDFNTYTASELGGGASQRNYAQTAAQEILLARQVMDRAGYPPRPASTIFFGGGTPTLLPAQDLVSLVSTVRQTWGLADGAEVTTEANPDSVTPHSMEILANGGFTRVSLGMQSVVPHVLATLERTHNPANVASAVRWAHEAGLEVSVDLIYGTPGESMDDWRRSLDAAIATGAGHVSAYALTVEQGTRMAVQVRRGDIELPSLDDQADKYEVADTVLSDAGYQWYEISNWARPRADGELAVCRHNLAYWRGHDWWGIGPGAHSFMAGDPNAHDDAPSAGVRWWNVKHPIRYAHALENGQSPAAGRELLTGDDAHLERVMLGIRLREGMPVQWVAEERREVLASLIARELIDARAVFAGRVQLTRSGRLMADAIVRDLT